MVENWQGYKFWLSKYENGIDFGRPSLVLDMIEEFSDSLIEIDLPSIW